MASVIQICNMALGRVGNSNPIASLSEQSAQARLCNANYEQCRDEVLQAYPWGFASKHVDLALIDEELVTNWQYCYAYPSDALRLFCLVPYGTRNPTLEESIPHEVLSYNGSRVILTDEADAEAFYAFRVTDSGQFTPLATKAIYLLLASVIAEPLTKKMDLAAKCEQDYFRAVSSAATADMNESNPGVPTDSDYITGRE